MHEAQAVTQAESGDTTGFILDKPHQIQTFVLLQVYHKLKMEVSHPGGPKWRVSPAQQARSILVSNDQPDPGRTKKTVLKAYEAWLRTDPRLAATLDHKKES